MLNPHSTSFGNPYLEPLRGILMKEAYSNHKAPTSALCSVRLSAETKVQVAPALSDEQPVNPVRR